MKIPSLWQFTRLDQSMLENFDEVTLPEPAEEDVVIRKIPQKMQDRRNEQIEQELKVKVAREAAEAAAKAEEEEAKREKEKAEAEAKRKKEKAEAEANATESNPTHPAPITAGTLQGTPILSLNLKDPPATTTSDPITAGTLQNLLPSPPTRLISPTGLISPTASAGFNTLVTTSGYVIQTSPNGFPPQTHMLPTGKIPTATNQFSHTPGQPGKTTPLQFTPSAFSQNFVQPQFIQQFQPAQSLRAVSFAPNQLNPAPPGLKAISGMIPMGVALHPQVLNIQNFNGASPAASPGGGVPQILMHQQPRQQPPQQPQQAKANSTEQTQNASKDGPNPPKSSTQQQQQSTPAMPNHQFTTSLHQNQFNPPKQQQNQFTLQPNQQNILQNQFTAQFQQRQQRSFPNQFAAQAGQFQRIGQQQPMATQFSGFNQFAAMQQQKPQGLNQFPSMGQNTTNTMCQYPPPQPLQQQNSNPQQPLRQYPPPQQQQQQQRITQIQKSFNPPTLTNHQNSGTDNVNNSNQYPPPAKHNLNSNNTMVPNLLLNPHPQMKNGNLNGPGGGFRNLQQNTTNSADQGRNYKRSGSYDRSRSPYHRSSRKSRSRERDYRRRSHSRDRKRSRRFRSRTPPQYNQPPKRRRFGRDKSYLLEEKAPSLEEYPLIISSTGPEKDHWTCALNDTKYRSFACLRKNPFDEETLREWFRLSEENIPWEQPNVNGKPLPRKAAFFVSSPDCSCHYRYSDTKWKPHVYPDWFRKITEKVCKKVGLDFKKIPNACNVNLYNDGMHSVGWHSDNEPLFESTTQDCLIISLSLGSTRKFQFQFQHEGATEEVRLGNGDIMTMEGLFQRYYSHRVPREVYCKQPRINFTWRFITRHYSHQDGCSLNREKSGVPGHNFQQYYRDQRFGKSASKRLPPRPTPTRVVEAPPCGGEVVSKNEEQEKQTPPDTDDRFDPNSELEAKEN